MTTNHEEHTSGRLSLNRQYDHQRTRVGMLSLTASRKAALVSAGLALPPGPWGFLTLIPELSILCAIQTNLVADIASVYGKTGTLSDEQVAWCLFKHSGAQGMRGLLLKLTFHAINKRIGRFIPVVGAIGVGIYAYADTQLVARRAIAQFRPVAARVAW